MMQGAVDRKLSVREAPAQGRLSSRPFARLLFIAGAVGIIGVTIDLVQGPPASALPTPTAQDSALAASPIDHSVVKNLVDYDASTQPGTSVAAYGASIDDSEATTPAPDLIDYDATSQPGTSVASYDS